MQCVFVGFWVAIALGTGTVVEQPTEFLNPSEFKVGQKGIVSSENSMFDYFLRVAEVLSEKEVLIKEHMGKFKSDPVRFIVEMPTKGLADDAHVKFEGVWEVSDTKKIGKKTYFLLRSVKDKK